MAGELAQSGVQRFVQPFPDVLSSRDVIVVAPTGSGKTHATIETVVDLVLLRRTFRRAVFTLPTKPLMFEVYHKLAARVGGNLVGIDNTDAQLFPWHIPSREWSKPLVVTSYEKFDHVLLKHPEVLRDTIVVMDEAHNMLFPDRSLALLDILANIKMFREEKGFNTRVVLLSATMPEMEGLARYLGGELIVHSVRPVEIEVRRVRVESGRWPRIRSRAYWLGKLPRVVGLVRELPRPVLVYVPSRSYSEMYANMISEMTSLKAVAHHAGLPPTKRWEIEAELRKPSPSIDVVVATDTLSQGVNMAFPSVVVAGVHRWTRSGPVPVEPAVIAQVMGRAGRPGYSDRGVAAVVYYDWEEDIVERALSRRFGEIKEPSDYPALYVRLVGSGRNPAAWSRHAYKVSPSRFSGAESVLLETGFLEAPGRLSGWGGFASDTYMRGSEMAAMWLVRRLAEDDRLDSGWRGAAGAAVLAAYVGNADFSPRWGRAALEAEPSPLEDWAFWLPESLSSYDWDDLAPFTRLMWASGSSVPDKVAELAPSTGFLRSLTDPIHGVDTDNILEVLKRASSLVAEAARRGLLPRHLQAAAYLAAAARAARIAVRSAGKSPDAPRRLAKIFQAAEDMYEKKVELKYAKIMLESLARPVRAETAETKKTGARVETWP